MIDRGRYQILPELAFSYGRTWIGDVGFTGRAYGLVDDTLSLDAGSVSLSDITFRPEFRFSLDGLPVVDSLSVFSFAPRFVCQELRTDTVTRGCGGGAEIGVSGQSADGQTTYDARIITDRVRNRTRAIGDWIGFYNHRRPHQALDMKTPAEAFALAA